MRIDAAEQRLLVVIAVSLLLPVVTAAIAFSHGVWTDPVVSIVVAAALTGVFLLTHLGFARLVVLAGARTSEDLLAQGVSRLFWLLVLLVPCYVALVMGTLLARGHLDFGVPMTAPLMIALWLMTATMILAPVLAGAPEALGFRFGSHLGGRVAIPVWTRNLPLICLAAASIASLPTFAWLSPTGFSAELVTLCLILLGYGIYVAHLDIRYVRSSIEPVFRFLERAELEATLGHEQLVSRSPDEVGLLVERTRALFERAEASRKRLAESETRLRMFAESSSDWFFEIDEHLRFSWVSGKLEEAVGVAPAEVVGRSAIEVGETSYMSAELRNHIDDLKHHRPYRDFRTEVVTEDGRHKFIQVSGLPFFDDDGRFCGYRGTGSDVTAMVHGQKRLLESEAQLGQAQKMEAVGQLTGGLAHDFNNLLTAIIGNLELAQAVNARGDANAPLLAEALDAAERGADVVQRLLAFSRRQELRPEALDVAALVTGMCPLLERTLGEDATLSISAASGLWLPLVDAGQLQSALLNLAINARDPMPPGGRLEIDLTNQALASPNGDLPAGDYLVIVVKDTGCGIDPQILPHVFDPFFSTKPEGKGSGLGLSMVFGFARQSGGAVHIDSSPGQGTRIELLLPRAA